MNATIKKLGRHTYGVFVNGEHSFTGVGALGRAETKCEDWLKSQGYRPLPGGYNWSKEDAFFHCRQP